jgi:TolA-binding protein
MKFSILILIALLAAPCASTLHGQSSKENADFKLAINLYNDGLFDLAAEQLRQFIGTFPSTPNSIQARFYLGLTQMKLKLFDDARLTFQTFALTYQEDPRAPEAWINVGECYAAVKNNKEAALAFERVKVFHPRSKFAPDALLKASRYFSQAGQPDDARRVLRIAIQEYANTPAALPARTLLGQMYFEEGNLVQAQNELKRVIEGDPSPDAKAQALLILGNIYQATGQASPASSCYDEIISKHKGSSAVPGAYLNLGKLRASDGNTTEAIESFKKAIAEKGHVDSGLVFQANTGIADCYLTNGEASQAIASLEKSIAYAPTPAAAFDTQWKIALSASRAQIYPKSNDACNRILKSTAPDKMKGNARLVLALNAEGRRDFTQAFQHFSSFIDQHPLDPATADVAFRIAQLAEREMRDPQKGSSLYEQFINRYPQSQFIDDAYAGAARCFDSLKEYDRTLHYYSELLLRFPSTEFRTEAEQRTRLIETFESKEKDAGVEKLALLVGDIVGDKDKIGMAFRLGEIYFNDLKNYAAAAAQYTLAINSGMTDARFVEALYKRARSYEFLSWKDGKYSSQAVEAYQTYLTAYPQEAQSDDAALAVFTLQATSPLSAWSAYAATIAPRQNFRYRDRVLLRLGSLQETVDSNQEALATYGNIVRDFPSSPAAEEAAYRTIPLLLKAGLADSAVQKGESYLATYPNNAHSARITALTAELLMNAGHPDRATQLYRRLIDDFPYTSHAVDARSTLADAEAAAGNFADAIITYQTLLAERDDNPLVNDSKDVPLIFALGKTEYQAGNMKDARAYLLAMVARERTGERAGAAYNILGMIARADNNIDLATSYFRMAGNATPGSATSRDVADLLFDNGAYADAIKQYTALLASIGSEAERQSVEARIAVALFRSDQFAAAEKSSAEFQKKYPKGSEDLATFELEKGLYHFRKEDYAAAARSLNRVADKFDDSPAAPYALYWNGKILESDRKQAEALKTYESILKNYPGSPVTPRVHLAMGNVFYNLEKWDESIKNYRTIVDNPQADQELLPLAMGNLIETYETAGIFDAALQLTRKYLELYPNNDDSFDKKIKIGILYQRLGYNDQSVLHLQALLDQAGSDLEGEIRYYIAEANYNKGDFQQAILDFLKVPYLVTKKGKMDWTANALYMAGQSYEKMGRFDQAMTMYQQILDRTGIDETFKVAAKKEIDRVKLVVGKNGPK